MKNGALQRVASVVAVAGAVGLVAAMLVDCLAVLGRHTGVPFMGSIEISQAFVIVMAGSSIAYASLFGEHAAVDLVFSRLPKKAQDVATTINGVMALSFILALLGASVWIAVEHWNAGERTELLGIPLKWLRLFWISMAVIAAAGFLLALVRRPKAGH